MDELPTLEKLKARNPYLYKKDILCIRCNKKEENIEHIWNCIDANNDMVIIEIKSRRFLNKILGSNKKWHEIVEALYKFTVIERHLRMFNSSTSTEPYRKQNDFCFERTYIWNENGSLDDLIRGWIPRELVEIFKKFNVKKWEYNEIIIRWITKLNKWFHNRVWKKRCEDIIKWKETQGITKKDKTSKSIKHQLEVREEKRKKVKEKR